ncbi:hypothetical protein C8Q77DRAFT_1026263, partial [Trametes polyzona]
MSLAQQNTRSQRPSVLLLYFIRDQHLQTTERKLYADLRQYANLLEARDAQTAMQHLSISPPPYSVLVADANITEPANVPLLNALVEYARRGGRVVFAARFSTHFPHFEVSKFFR